MKSKTFLIRLFGHGEIEPLSVNGNKEPPVVPLQTFQNARLERTSRFYVNISRGEHEAFTVFGPCTKFSILLSRSLPCEKPINDTIK